MKRVLVISNGCFSLNDSNGRTLAKLFSGATPDKLAQLYIYGTPDFSVCSKFYRITDKDALKSFITRKSYGGEVVDEPKQSEAPSVAKSNRKGKKTPFKMLLREMAWKFSNCFKGNFGVWLKAFSPEEILLFAGDSAFLMNIAANVAREFNIPITIYSTEDYYFKKYNYVTKHKSLFFNIFKRFLEKSYENVEKYVKHGFFNTDMLTDMYSSGFGFPCSCMYARSDMDFKPSYEPAEPGNVKVSYLGNLGLKRHIPLCELADALAKVAPGTKLNVYGSAKPEVEQELRANPNVNFNGFVDYEQVVEIMHSSDLLIHSEYSDEYNNLDLKAAFSTKIPDSISSGTPLLIYANEELACTDFVIKNKCAFVVKDKTELEEVLRTSLFDKEKRVEVIEYAEKARNEFFVSDNSLTACFD